MSGGHFDYTYGLYDIADVIDSDLKMEGKPKEEDSDYCFNFESDKARKYAKDLVDRLRKLADVVHAYDYYLSCDYSEEDFIKAYEEAGFHKLSNDHNCYEKLKAIVLGSGMDLIAEIQKKLENE